MKQPKDKLVAALTRLGSAAKKNKDAIKQKTEDTMDVVYAAAGAGGVGWYMGGRKHAVANDASLATVEEKEEAMKLFGAVDYDLAVGATLTLMGLSGIGGKAASTLKGLGTGVLAYYAGSKAEQAAFERAETAASK